MPYNTRRKSLSLPSLGIQLPNSSRSSASNRSPPAAMPALHEENQPPAKKVKRSHTTTSASPAANSPLSRQTSLKFRDDRPRSAGRVAEQTPPPSPGEADSFTVDTDGIDDEIVVAVIQQLQKTGNRPHLLKELAAVLSNQLPIVESSANPPAIISSRLQNYRERRPWSAIAPCPIGKDLIGTHPKRLYFFLTNSPHQPFPESDELPSNSKRIISPSLSSAADEDERDNAARRALSPSPEVDLSSPEFEDDSSADTPGAPFSGRNSVSGDGTHPPTLSNISHNRRAVSPPLERDEREFTQTASSLQQRQRSKSLEEAKEKEPELQESAASEEDGVPEMAEDSEEHTWIRHDEAAAALFGHQPNNHMHANPFLQSSPVLKPHLEIKTEVPLNPGPLTGLSNELKGVSMVDKVEIDDMTWAELDRPEDVGLDELDKWFD